MWGITVSVSRRRLSRLLPLQLSQKVPLNGSWAYSGAISKNWLSQAESGTFSPPLEHCRSVEMDALN